MNKQKFSAIAHRDHDYCNPISAAKVERLVATLDAPPFEPLAGTPKVRKVLLGSRTLPIS